MADFIRLEVKANPGSALKRLAELRGGITTNVNSVMTQLANRLTRTAKAQYLSGPRPSKLGVVTGRLRASVTSRSFSDSRRVGVLFGTNVEYAARHELGFRGRESVPAHTRLIKQAFGRALKMPKTVNVRAHSRNINLPARPFLQPALADNRAWFQKSIERAAQLALEGRRG